MLIATPRVASPKRGKGTWDEFVKIHADTLWQVDFFSKNVITKKGIKQAFVLAFQRHFDQVSELIEGFETPYGMELLSTVHWVAIVECPEARSNVDAAIREVHAWNSRKREIMQPAHITAAWNTLHAKNWL